MPGFDIYHGCKRGVILNPCCCITPTHPAQYLLHVFMPTYILPQQLLFYQLLTSDAPQNLYCALVPRPTLFYWYAHYCPPVSNDAADGSFRCQFCHAIKLEQWRQGQGHGGFQFIYFLSCRFQLHYLFSHWSFIGQPFTKYIGKLSIKPKIDWIICTYYLRYSRAGLDHPVTSSGRLWEHETIIRERQTKFYKRLN